MKTCFTYLVHFLRDEQGTSSIEYAALLSLVVLSINVSVETLGNAVSGKYDQANGAFASSNANPGSSSSSSSSGSSGTSQPSQHRPPSG
jgi:Flp pilus assembly pilin Flp